MPADTSTAAPATLEAGSEGTTPLSDILDHLDPDVRLTLGKAEQVAPKVKKGEKVTPAEEEKKETTEEEESTEEQTQEEATEEEEEHHVSENVQKRIDKLTRKASDATAEATRFKEEAATAKAEAESYKKELESRSPVKLEATADDPLAHIDSLEELDTSIATAKRVRAWAHANPDGGTIRNADGSERYIDRAEVLQWLASTDALLTDHAPSRKEYLRERAQILPVAREVYPELFKSGSPAQKMLVDTLKAVPSLKRLAGYEMVIGDAIVGMSLRLQKGAATESGKKVSSPALPAKRAIAPSVPSSTAPGKPQSQTGKAKSSAHQRVLEVGDVDSLANYFETAANQ